MARGRLDHHVKGRVEFLGAQPWGVLKQLQEEDQLLPVPERLQRLGDAAALSVAGRPPSFCEELLAAHPWRQAQHVVWRRVQERPGHGAGDHPWWDRNANQQGLPDERNSLRPATRPDLLTAPHAMALEPMGLWLKWP